MGAYERETVTLGGREPELCALVQDLLPLYLEGEVSPASRAQIAAHLGHCTYCTGFLAGARSVEGLLRRDLAHYHARAVTGPPPPAARRWPPLLVAPLVLLVCVVGGLGAALAADGLRAADGGELAVGSMIGGGALTGLLLLAAALAPLSVGRLWRLGAGVGTGVVAAFILMNGLGMAQVAAILLALIATAMTIGAVLHEPARPRGGP